ncbi:hypothetical protein TSUD_134230 [Trifolium subterraneum]|uniref:Uncharacterized protein n=1 Tax=Trifolium subterraneum TaxID=3900 RepID=A0A2Z6NP94_TRISU|nr:hypothetical protein TSUD_134230 [Trifolium subterraneum]
MKVPSAVPNPTVTKHYVEKTTKGIPIPVVNVEDETDDREAVIAANDNKISSQAIPIIQAADRDAEITANGNNSQTAPFIQAAPAENQVQNFAPNLEKIPEHELIEQPVVEDNSLNNSQTAPLILYEVPETSGELATRNQKLP